MPTVKEDLERLKKEFFEGNSVDVKDFIKNSHQISTVLSDLQILMLQDYRKEFDLARKAGLLKVTYLDNDWQNTEYIMKGIPCENLEK